MKRVMIDLETLGVNPGCVILAVGAVLFNGDCAGEWFYSRVDLRGSLKAKYHVEADTLAWWFRHGEAALEFSTSGGEELPDALARFRRWLGDGTVEVWGNGSTFDNEILRRAFHRCELHELVWPRRQDACYRTLCGTAGAGIPVDFDAVLPLIDPPEWWGAVPRHHALRDAACQAAHAVKILTRVGVVL